eukprot:CAMPEP_0176473694 /NCGR_PEP_ID=MMETSP0127-20121128/42468_1 /TAXON_ID=938130 /ORGANISM="Platyophrya macrostoma, Strain WH" /LENGTH=70 /DNA_ID=CAMNT_0017868757 /DNA_START=26 /DNA_END=238 /DNA_ORIENTATION=+
MSKIKSIALDKEPYSNISSIGNLKPGRQLMPMEKSPRFSKKEEEVRDHKKFNVTIETESKRSGLFSYAKK